MLGHARDDPQFFIRAITYLVNPPARAVLRPTVVTPVLAAVDTPDLGSAAILTGGD